MAIVKFFTWFRRLQRLRGDGRNPLEMLEFAAQTIRVGFEIECGRSGGEEGVTGVVGGFGRGKTSVRAGWGL
jgi:hypothetical protein